MKKKKKNFRETKIHTQERGERVLTKKKKKTTTKSLQKLWQVLTFKGE